MQKTPDLPMQPCKLKPQRECVVMQSVVCVSVVRYRSWAGIDPCTHDVPHTATACVRGRAVPHMRDTAGGKSVVSLGMHGHGWLLNLHVHVRL